MFPHSTTDSVVGELINTDYSQVMKTHLVSSQHQHQVTDETFPKLEASHLLLMTSSKALLVWLLLLLLDSGFRIQDSMYNIIRLEYPGTLSVLASFPDISNL